jgi:hypothetical protein
MITENNLSALDSIRLIISVSRGRKTNPVSVILSEVINGFQNLDLNKNQCWKLSVIHSVKEQQEIFILSYYFS